MIAKVVLGTMQNARNPGGAPANVAVAASLLFYIIHREISSPLPSSLYGDTRIIHKMQNAV